MLVLTRKLGEKVAIGDDVILTVTRIEGNHVRLAFDAPRDVAIDREEYRYPEGRDGRPGADPAA